MGIFNKVCLLLIFVMICDFCTADEDDAFGGVSIKVFRGPSKGKGRNKFAPFGYYVKMPVDSSAYLLKQEASEEEDQSMEMKDDDEEDKEEKVDSDEDF